jgi:hypothetical protein
MTAYFHRLTDTRYDATDAVQGAWNTTEQHIAPALGLLTHAVEQHHFARRATPMLATRLSFDILGTLPLDTVDIHVEVERPGRSIELLRATLSHDSRPAVVLHAWMQHPTDTSHLAGGHLPAMPPPGDVPPWDPSELWPGRFVATVEARRHETEPGRAQSWLRPRVPLLDREHISTTAAMMSVLDIANGLTPRHSPEGVAFPNLDTTVHLFTPPRSDWIGYDTAVTFGPTGTGLTHTVLHDTHGPIGTAQQILTIRPR